MIQNSTDIQAPPNKSGLPSLLGDAGLPDSDRKLQIETWQQVENYEQVSVDVKIIREKQVEEVKSGLIKQDYMAADATGTIILTAWGNNFDALNIGTPYALYEWWFTISMI